METLRGLSKIKQPHPEQTKQTKSRTEHSQGRGLLKRLNEDSQKKRNREGSTTHNRPFLQFEKLFVFFPLGVIALRLVSGQQTFEMGVKWEVAAPRAAECWFTCCRGGAISLWTASRQQPQQNAAKIPKYHSRYSPSLIRVLWFLFQVGYGLCLLRGKKPDKSGCVNNLSSHRFVCETVWDAYNEDNGDCSINSTQVRAFFFSFLLFFFFSTAVKCWRWRGRRREDH